MAEIDLTDALNQAIQRERAEMTKQIMGMEGMAQGAYQYIGWIIDNVFIWLDRNGYEIKKRTMQ